jgi:PIN domain
MTGRVCVLLDANAWISERLLRSGMGAALIHMVLQQQWRIGLLESVEREATQRLIDQGVKANAEVQRGTRWLEQLTGQPLGRSAFDEAAIRHGIEQRWQELAPVIERLPLSMDIVRAALDRVIKRIPPATERSEEFRDCCVWEHAVQMAGQCEVHLVTSDGDFYEKGSPQSVLATALHDHAASLTHSIVLHRTVADCVKSLEEAVPIRDETELAEKISAYVEPELKKNAAERNFELGYLASFSVKSFPTDKPTAIAISYELTYELTDQNSPQQRSSATVSAYGNCTFDPTTRTISDLRPDRETFSWIDAQGVQQQNSNHYAYAYFGGISMMGSPHALLFSPPG